MTAESIVFSNFGVELIRRDGGYFLRYDSGEIVGKMVEVQISEQEADRVKLSERDAYEVILAHQRARG